MNIVINQKKKRAAQKEDAIKDSIKKAIVNYSPFEDEKLQKKGVEIPVLVRAMESVDAVIDNKIWRNLKEHLATVYLFPWAMRNAKSFWWSHRCLSARIFLLYPVKEHLHYLKTFLNDSSFFIRMLSVAALSKIIDKETLTLILEKMAQEIPQARFPYRYALLNAGFESQLQISQIYEHAGDERLRLACLDIMSRRIVSKPLQLIKRDYRSPNPDIRLYVVKILGNLASDEAAGDLTLFLKDSDPRVRREALISLGRLRSDKTFDKVAEMLHDADYSVRLQAALTLLHFDAKGKRVLETQDWDLDPLAFEVARYVLTMP